MSEGTLTGPADEPGNQPPPLAGYNAYSADPAMVEAVTRLYGAGSATHVELLGLGGLAGSFQARERGRLVEAKQPALRTHDRLRRRIHEGEIRPAGQELRIHG